MGLSHSQFLSWPAEDQDKALAYLRFERQRCSGCGTRKAEWERDPFAYVGNTRKCPGCEVLEQEAENVDENDRSRAWKHGLVPKAVGEALMRAEGGTP